MISIALRLRNTEPLAIAPWDCGGAEATTYPSGTCNLP